jgi:hypothetical protein
MIVDDYLVALSNVDLSILDHTMISSDALLIMVSSSITYHHVSPLQLWME